MKKKLYSIIFLCFFTVVAPIIVNAQAWVEQGNSVAATSYLGTSNTDDVRICTNNGGSVFNLYQQKMLITSGGNVGIAYDGSLVNAPATPANKLLVQNGQLGNLPYSSQYILGVPTSAIGIYSNSNNASGGFNMPIVATAFNDGAINIGLATNIAGNLAATNIGLFDTIAGDGSDNTGAFVMVGGTGSNNTGGRINVSGTNGSDEGIDIDVTGNYTSGPSMENIGAKLNISGSNVTRNGAFNVHCFGSGGSIQENEGMYILCDDPNVYDNTGIVMDLLGARHDNLGIHIRTIGNGVGANTGVYSESDNATNWNISGHFHADAGGNNALTQGLQIEAQNSLTENRGIDVETRGVGSPLNQGVVVNVAGDNGVANVGMNMSVSGIAATNNLGIKMLLNSAGARNTGFTVDVSNAVSQNVGGRITVNGNAPTNDGIFARTTGAGTLNIGANIESESDGSGAVFGVIGRITGVTGGATNYGIYGAALSGSGVNPPTNGSPGSAMYAGYFDGDVFTSDTYYYSDEKLKNDIKDYKGALEQLNQLPVKQYTFKRSDFPDMNLPYGQRVGVISSDLKKVFPNLVKQSVHPGMLYNKENVSFEAVNYNALIPVLIQAVKELSVNTDPSKAVEPLAATIKEQQAQIDQLISQLNSQNTQLNSLKDFVNDICNQGCAGFQGSNWYGANPDVQLYQSIPNPTNGSATIGYIINIPFSTASIKVTSMLGNVIKEFKISQQGSGNVVFDGTQYASGSFNYTLYVDGKKYDTKTIIVVSK